MHFGQPQRRTTQVWRILFALIACAVFAAGCAAASTSDGEPDAAVANAAAALEDAAEAAVEDSESSGNTTPALTEGDSDAAPNASPDDAADASADVDAAADDTTVAADPTPEPTPSTNDELADEFADAELPPAPIGFEALTPEPGGRQPVSIVIEDIDVVDATIIPVGVNPDQTFEVPPADQVGWYRFGPAPGDEGSAVLAAHIAFDGVDGVFRHLADVEVGSVVVVGYDDGTSQRYRIDSVTDYFKEELPPELFARDGDTQLALITCGGTFNPQLRSYESNTVAVATPI